MKKILILLLALGSLTANAAPEYRELYVQVDTNVRIYISNGECLKWKAPEGVQLNYAYAINTDTKEKVTGCYTHDEKYILIQLTDEPNKKHYEYQIRPDAFLVAPTL